MKNSEQLNKGIFRAVKGSIKKNNNQIFPKKVIRKRLPLLLEALLKL